MFYLKVSFHVFNYKDKHNRNRPPPSINLVPKRLNVQDRFVTCQIYDLVFLGEQFMDVCGILSMI